MIWFALNVAGLVSGFASVLIFLFGVPRQLDEQGGSSIRIGGPDPRVAAKVRRYKTLAGLGFALLALSFLLQGAALIGGEVEALSRYAAGAGRDCYPRCSCV